MLLPYIASEDAWLSEGAASYYQNVLRARAGMIAVDDAWHRMHAGFRRGMKSLRGVTLADATERMFRDGAFMRVYWSGAAIMLLADQRLRERTAGEQSLDRALDALGRCCLSGPRAWRGRALMDKLDELTGTTVFRELHDTYVGSERFPDFGQAYARLGLRVAPDEESIELTPDAPQIGDRDAMMHPAGG
jgi:predicted metalloprotease with PDZ domain